MNSPYPPDPVATALLEWKKRERLTVLEMADAIGFAPRTVGELMRGQRQAETRALIKIAKFFEWTTEELGAAVMWVPEQPKRGKKYGKHGGVRDRSCGKSNATGALSPPSGVEREGDVPLPADP